MIIIIAKSNINWSKETCKYKNEGHYKVPIFFLLAIRVYQEPSVLFLTMLVEGVLSGFVKQILMYNLYRFYEIIIQGMFWMLLMKHLTINSILLPYLLKLILQLQLHHRIIHLLLPKHTQTHYSFSVFLFFIRYDQIFFGLRLDLLHSVNYMMNKIKIL